MAKFVFHQNPVIFVDRCYLLLHCLLHLSRSVIVIETIYIYLCIGRSHVGGQEVVLKPGRRKQETRNGGREGGPLIGKMLLLIRAITQCHNYQCHQLVCNKFYLHPGTDQHPR